MPANRAILSDIDLHGLNPAKPYSAINGMGQLKPIVDESAKAKEVTKEPITEIARESIVEEKTEVLMDNNNVDAQDSSPRQETEESKDGTEAPEDEVKIVKKKKVTKKSSS